jgi:hypothetical protein
MALRPLIAVAALALLAAGCGGNSAAPPAAATPHLAESEVATQARGDGTLALAWAQALRVASASDLGGISRGAAAPATDARRWYLVATCSFGASAGGYWSNPVDHEVVDATGDAAPADLPSGACDPDAASPPAPPATGDACIDSWNLWIVDATAPFREAAAGAKAAFTARLDGRCLVVLIAGRETVTLTEEPGGAWTFLDSSTSPPDPNAVVHADGTIAPD